MTPAHAWKLALPRAAQDVLGVAAGVLRVEESRVVVAALGDLVPAHGLIALIEGPEGRFGVAILDAPLLSGLIEAATTGRVSPRVPAPREPTRTDAIIVADVLDALLEGFETSLAEMEEAPNLGGYRYAAPLTDARAMTMALAEGPCSVFRLALDLGGVREGELMVAFPAAPRGVARGADTTAFQQALAENVMAARAELDGVLIRFERPLAEVTQLAVGDVLRVPLAALAAVRLEAGGRVVARARLGQQGGSRAVRLTEIAGLGAEPEPEGDFVEAAPAALPPG